LSIALGDILRKAREAKGLTIEQLSALTRINSLFIVALEEGRWDRLPGHVYLKPFAKTCAEALGLDLKEIYKIIDGEEMEKTQVLAAPQKAAPKFRFDYKVPLVVVVGAVIIGLIYITVRYQRGVQPGSKNLEIVPANGKLEKREIVWNRPWEKPAAWEIAHPGSRRLRLEASDPVWVSVSSGPDTLFEGIIDGGAGMTFFSENGFVLSAGKNEFLVGYLDGDKIPAIGATSGRLNRYQLNTNAEEK